MEDKSAQVVDINDRFYWSLSQLQKAFGFARETISKRLHQADIQAVKQRGGHDVFHIADASRAIIAGEQPSFEEIKDPDKLDPKGRLDWYKGHNEKAKFLRESSTLIPVDEVSQEMAGVVKICVRAIQTLPDVLEMKCQLKSDAVQMIEAECDSACEQLAKELAE